SKRITYWYILQYIYFFFQAEDGIRDRNVTGVQTCALPISFLRDIDHLPCGCSERPAKQLFGDVGGQPGTAERESWLEGNALQQIDRKSTRLNSSHVSISYAVFCLKKKKKNNIKL